MDAGKIVRRFLVPSPAITLYYLIKFGAKISPKAEVELSSFFTIGRQSVISSFTKIKASEGPLKIGSHVSISTGCFISSHTGGLEIGDYCLVGPNVTIVGNNYNYSKIDVPLEQQGIISKGIRIGSNVWLGAGVCVLDGVTVGDNCIITPNSVISSNIPSGAIASGQPAKVIFKRR
ncbi:DapH/DapD/GlmU-related protein [Acaryochloris marina]|uniref:acyltransferase n=1 Tax=Acaryochloris marina TaxID=155978 RepID=UPI001BAEFEAE|nr:acyltransferase [Acaryochloris marina]QUY42270.1 acyltransferase [Acaryochloris marina S15]